MYDRKILISKIIRVLLCEKSLSISRLCELTGIGRDTLSRELEKLMRGGMVGRKNGKYSLGEGFCVLILKAKEGEGELIVFDGSRDALERHNIPFSYAASRESNIAMALSSLNSCRRALSNNGREAVCCFMYADGMARIHSLPDIFDATDSSEDLSARGLADLKNKACLFVSDRCFICAEGKSVTRSAKAPNDIRDYLEKLFDYIRPESVVIENGADVRISSLCREKGIECDFIKFDNAAALCEIELAAEGVAEFISRRK